MCRFEAGSFAGSIERVITVGKGEKKAESAEVSSAGEPSCPCRLPPLLFEQMFEYPQPQIEPISQPTGQAEIALFDGEPVEFTYRGRRYRIHLVLSRWREAGGWWNRASDGNYRPDDGARALWRVEAAPIGVMTTFEIERIDRADLTAEEAANGFLWRIRPSSRPSSHSRSQSSSQSSFQAERTEYTSDAS